MEMNEMWGNASAVREIDPAKAEFFRRSKYAMFIHWGLYSQAAGHWRDQNFYGISEWLMNCMKVPVRDYETLAKQFNPTDFNAADLVSKIKSYGMKYLVITAKHHEGFAMFKSCNSYNIVDATPFGRDVMKELSEECARQKIGLGFYYSQFLDWHEINDWDKTDGQRDFDDYFENKCLPQIEELLTGYGNLSMIWFDTPGNLSADCSQRIVDLVHTHQPQALVNSRIGNDAGEYISFGDQEIPPVNVPGLWESIDTINDSWGHTWYDTNFYYEKTIVKNLLRTVARGGNYMLNIGLDGRGLVDEMSDTFLKKAGLWLSRHGEAVYGADSSPWPFAQSWGEATRKDNHLYLFIFDYKPGMKIELYGLPQEITAVRFAGRELRPPEWSGTWHTITLPLEHGTECVEVVEVEFAENLKDIDELNVPATLPSTLLVDVAECVNCKPQKLSWMEKFGEWKHQTCARVPSPEGALRWHFNLKESGLYRIEVEYTNVAQRAWQITTDEGESIHFWSRNASTDGKAVRFQKSEEGIIRFKTSGKHTLEFKPEPQQNFDGLPYTPTPSIDIHALHLIPIDS